MADLLMTGDQSDIPATAEFQMTDDRRVGHVSTVLQNGRRSSFFCDVLRSDVFLVLARVTSQTGDESRGTNGEEQQYGVFHAW